MNNTEIRKSLIEDIKNDAKVISFVFKYLPDVITDDFLAEVVEAKIETIDYIPKEYILSNEKITWVIIKALSNKSKDYSYFEFISKDIITDEMEDFIIHNFNHRPLYMYLNFRKGEIKIETMKSIIICREYLDNIPKLVEFVQPGYDPEKFYMELITEYDPSVIKVMDEDLKSIDICVAAVRQYDYTIRYVPKELREQVREILEKER